MKNTSGYYGSNKAKQALKYVKNGSASIMESLVFMIFTLPYSLGGYGLTGACFNKEILLGAKAKQQLDQVRCFMDLYYEEEKVAIEYDSFEYHNSPSSQGKDQLRATLIKQQGVEVIHLSTIQLYDKDLCEKFVRRLSARLRKRIRIRSNGFHMAHSKLRKLLPRKKQDKDGSMP